MFDEYKEHMHEPHRRMNPPFVGEVDTTQMGGIYDVQHMHTDGDPHAGYKIPSVPPLSPYFGNLTVNEQLRDLGAKVNELCETMKGANRKVEDAYETILNSAICNDSYYREVWTENGYMPESGANYKVVHIPFTDRANQPIFMELGLAYDNTTNSGVTEECFSASQRFMADKLIPAQNKDTTFTGTVTWKGAPIYTAEGDAYTFGITQHGFFKAYKNATAEVLKTDHIRNSCGARGIIVYNKEKATTSYPTDSDTMKARVAVGQNYDTKERFIIVVDGGESDGCTSDLLADLFIKYGCMVALELCSGSSTYGMDKGGMMFTPAVASEDDTPSVPVSNAFWYITKRRHYHNDYVKDVALLAQRYGEELWRRKILNEQTDYVKGRVVELAKELKTETDERKAADEALTEHIDTEVKRLDEECERIETESKSRDDALNSLILEKETESKARDTELQQNIDDEAELRQLNDVKEVAHVDDGDKRTYSLYRNNGTKIAENIEVYEYNKLVAQLQTLGEVAENLKTEVSERKKADDALQAQITEEVAARTLAITELTTKVDGNDAAIKALIKAEETARIAGDTELESAINTLKTDYSTFKASVEGDIEAANTRMDSIVKDFTNIQTIIDTHTTQMSSINATITALQTTISTMETSLENMKATVSNLQTSFEEFKTNVQKQVDECVKKVNECIQKVAELEELIKNFDGKYVPFTGGTLTGALNVIEPTEDSNATTKKYVDDLVKTVEPADMTETELAELVAIFA